MRDYAQRATMKKSAKPAIILSLVALCLISGGSLFGLFYLHNHKTKPTRSVTRLPAPIATKKPEPKQTPHYNFYSLLTNSKSGSTKP